MRTSLRACQKRPDPKGFTVWFTGLPCSGKTTLSALLTRHLLEAGLHVEQLDGDVLRRYFSRDLGYSKEDRKFQAYRVAEIASDLNRKGAITVVSLVSPYRDHRDHARERIGSFIEVYVRCPIAVCESRDTKGMYRLARQGKIKNFTGVSDPYEEPASPEIILDTDRSDSGSCVRQVLGFLMHKDHLPVPDLKNMPEKKYEFSRQG